MKLEDQVCSLELSKQLKELGFEQESLFWWVAGIVYPTKRLDWHLEDDKEYAMKWEKQCSAYTVAELGEIYPDRYLVIKKGSRFQAREAGKIIPIASAKTEANARAKMLIYLKENKLI